MTASETTPADATEPARVALCLGGGGAFGIGMHDGVLRALVDDGMDLSTATFVGTSAGAWAASAFVLGMDLEQVMAPWAEGPTKRYRNRSIDTARAAFGDARSDRVTGVALRTPDLRRVLLSGRDHALADIVAAASSPPPWAVAHPIGEHRYLDAGLRSNTSAQLSPAADLLIVCSPIAGPAFGRLGRVLERQAHIEIGRWTTRTGGSVLYLRPTVAMRPLAGKGTRGLFDHSRAGDTSRAAHALTLERLAVFRRRHPAVVARCSAT